MPRRQNFSYHQRCEKAICFVYVVQMNLVLAPVHMDTEPCLELCLSLNEALNPEKNHTHCFSLLFTFESNILYE